MLDLYGVEEPGDGIFASNCLLARRLAERGVRFIQLYHRAWDHHGNIDEGHAEGRARCATRPTAALIKDLKQRGHARRHADPLGRRIRPHADGPGRTGAIITSSASRSGSPAAASKRGMTYGATDELGYRAVDKRGQRPRPARHDAASLRHRPQTAEREIPGPRRPAYGNRGGVGEGGRRLATKTSARQAFTA